MSYKKQTGNILLAVLVVFGAGAILAYNLLEQENIKSLGKTAHAYSAQYSVAVDKGYSTKLESIAPGLYRHDGSKDDFKFRASIAFHRNNTFQMDFVTYLIGKEEKPKASYSLQGTYRQSGAVVEYDNLVGDVALISQQRKALLSFVGDNEINFTDESKSSEFKVLSFRKVASSDAVTTGGESK